MLLALAACGAVACCAAPVGRLRGPLQQLQGQGEQLKQQRWQGLGRQLYLRQLLGQAGDATVAGDEVVAALTLI